MKNTYEQNEIDNQNAERAVYSDSCEQLPKLEQKLKDVESGKLTDFGGDVFNPNPTKAEVIESLKALIKSHKLVINR